MKRAAFVEDYDLTVATRLVAGCDVWLNLARESVQSGDWILCAISRIVRRGR